MAAKGIVEIRWHGRGGQGAVTSAELLALAAISEGKYAQAFPSFGPERRGAPVLAFNRLSAAEPIRLRAGITNPDVVVVLDPGLLKVVDVASGLRPGGIVVINTRKTIDELKSEVSAPRLATVNATAIARRLLGVPIVNTTMLGAVVKTTGVVDLKSLDEPIKERFGARGAANIKACLTAYEETKVAEVELVGKAARTFPAEVLPGWREWLPGCVVIEPGSASYYATGDWRSQRPAWNKDRCIKCGICYLFCPEGCIRQDDAGYFEANYHYCKGCGICARECWTGAISMSEEVE